MGSRPQAQGRPPEGRLGGMSPCVGDTEVKAEKGPSCPWSWASHVRPASVGLLIPEGMGAKKGSDRPAGCTGCSYCSVQERQPHGGGLSKVLKSPPSVNPQNLKMSPLVGLHPFGGAQATSSLLMLGRGGVGVCQASSSWRGGTGFCWTLTGFISPGSLGDGGPSTTNPGGLMGSLLSQRVVGSRIPGRSLEVSGYPIKKVSGLPGLRVGGRST